MLKVFPFMALAVAAYDAAVLGTGTPLDQAIGGVSLPSGVVWSVSLADAIVVGALLLLFVEILAATSTRRSSIVNHGLSTLVFVVCVVEFLLIPGCGTTAFFLITLMTLLDVVAGFSISILTARRDWSVERL
jgi:hypothetical protein